ncbi:MAG: hypothetical protein JWM88_464 [Verrucomicrobia bacterium]|nr:hypothetical protein [Verrucomicrobiota bacterium]
MISTIAGKKVGLIGLGCATFGREIDEAASFVLMDDAVARGVTLFDTAAAYSAGGSERIVGRWFADRRPAGVVLATKLIPPYEPAKILAKVDECLGRLGVPAIDLLYLHHWNASVETPELLRALDEVVRSGKARALGASNFNAAQLSAALDRQAQLGLARFEVIQQNHNFAVSELDAPLLELCAARGIAMVTYSPLGAGFLTGKHRGGVEAGSRFAIVPGHQDIYFNDRAWGRLARLEAVAAKLGCTPAHLALAWALHRRPVTTVLIGGRAVRHLEQGFAALGLNDPAVFAEMEAD